jgi:hypothetical protein
MKYTEAVSVSSALNELNNKTVQQGLSNESSG